MTTPKKKIVISLPGNNFSKNFLMCWTNLITKLSNSKYNIMFTCEYSSFVPFARMKTLGLNVLKGPKQKPFDGNFEFDVWVTIDSDIIFTYEQFIELVESTELYPVVSGIYKMSNVVDFACVKDWDIDYFKKTGNFKFISENDIAKMDKFEEVAYNGMGFFACKREIFNKLQYPYFHRELEEIKDKDGNVIITEMCSEDVAFCKNLSDAGIKIIVNTKLIVGHEKLFVI
jgi:hypothetical protein